MMRLYLPLLLLLPLYSYSQLNPYTDSIPMRDGRKLAASIHIPTACPSCPVVVIQTPYWRDAYTLIGLPLNVGFNINASNYAFVIVDWRGFYGSIAAAYPSSPTRGEDGYDVIEWVNTQPFCNGMIGTWGPSALGRIQFMTAKEDPPALDCIVPLVAGPQYSYLEYFPGGVYRTEYIEQLDALGFGMSTTLLSNPTYSFLWQFVENDNFYPDSIKIPALMIGGWYDHTIEVMLPFFNAIRTQSPVSVQNQHRLLMGPWVHGGSGPAQVGTAAQGQLSYPNAADWNDSLALLFLDYHLRGINNNWNNTPYIQYYQMGSNVWMNSATWPPAGLTNTNLYLHPDGSLNNVMPVNSTGSLNFLYDPTDPSPTIGGTTLRTDLDQGPYDQAPIVESRFDVLSFTSTTLGADVIMKGKAQAYLKVSSNKLDTDFSIRLTDVYPDGRSMLLHDGIRRMRFRTGYSDADSMVMVPNTIYDCVIDLPSTCITFKAGHKIRVDITSSNYPRFNRNDNSGGVMYPGLNGDSLGNPQIATNTIYTNSTSISYIRLPLVDFNGGFNETPSQENYFTAYPNPASNNITINLIRDISGELELLNSIGLRVRHWSLISSSNKLNLKDIAPGIYFIRLTTSDGIQTQKVIISGKE